MGRLNKGQLLSSTLASYFFLFPFSFCLGQDQDRVTLQTETSSSRITFRCTILDYTGKKLTVRRKIGDNVHEYPASQVVGVETPQTAAHVKGLVRFSENLIEEAAEAFVTALRIESRVWVRREILALLVRCALRQGNHASAGARFLSLVRSDQTTRHFGLIPLAWMPQSANLGLKNIARTWISQQQPTARLMGAAILLDDAAFGEEAENELKRLSTNPNSRVHLLARAQLWRLRLRSGALSHNELLRWRERIESMPEGLRTGPYYLLGRARFRRQEYELAAVNFLWLPLVYDSDHHLAARACLDAADALARIGKNNESQTLYLEVAGRFRGTLPAQEAASILKSRSSQSSPEQ